MSIVSARRLATASDCVGARVSVVWRAFDLQLASYAAAARCAFGLAMAYSNTAAAGLGIFDGGSVFLAGPDVVRDRHRRVRSSRPRSTTTGCRRSRGRSTWSSSACSS